VGIAQLLPYNESIGAGGEPLKTLVEDSVCGDKAVLAVALLRIAGYETCVLDINEPTRHAAIAVHLSKPPRFAIKAIFRAGGKGNWTFWWSEEWSEDPWYVVFKGRRYYVVESVVLHTIGTLLWPSAFKRGLVGLGWPYHGEKPEKIHHIETAKADSQPVSILS